MTGVRGVWVLMFAALAALLTGCSPNYHVIQQASPNPFVGQTRFAVMPVEMKGLRVGDKTEESYLAEKDEGQRESFRVDKEAMQHRFDAALVSGARDEGIEVGAAGQAPFVIRPRITFVEPGFYAVVASGRSRVEMRIQITTPDGKVLDEIEAWNETDSRSGASVGGISLNPSSGGRLRDDAAGIGQTLADYLAERVHP
jgi:hypothetical protein